MLQTSENLRKISVACQSRSPLFLNHSIMCIHLWEIWLASSFLTPVPYYCEWRDGGSIRIKRETSCTATIAALVHHRRAKELKAWFRNALCCIAETRRKTLFISMNQHTYFAEWNVLMLSRYGCDSRLPWKARWPFPATRYHEHGGAISVKWIPHRVTW